MSRIKVLLWDLDGTILNFEKAEEFAIHKCFELHDLGICSGEMLETYKVINRKYWEALEKGEMTKDQILVERFKEFFKKYKLDTSKAEAFNNDYQIRLGDTICFNDNAYDIIEELSSIFPQYVVTNGTAVAQHRKLRNSHLDDVFDDVFISDVLRHEKPTPEFFRLVLHRIGDYKKDEIMIIGDSLTSDIRGGNNAGILTCWYNPTNLDNPKNEHVDYEIRDLHELYDILKFNPS